MNKTILSSALAGALLALGAAAPTGAQAQTATPEASPLTFNAAVFSEYRYRGISQTRFQPAVQAGADYAFPSGFYLGAWASTIKWIKDAKGGADVEIDLYGGYKGTLAEGLAYDVGALRYVYPSNGLKPSADTQEVYGAITAGAFTVKYSHATSNLFGFADSAGSGYLDVPARGPPARERQGQRHLLLHRLLADPEQGLQRRGAQHHPDRHRCTGGLLCGAQRQATGPQRRGRGPEVQLLTPVVIKETFHEDGDRHRQALQA
jgi:uncharacterized protein (TIGR02001 family)